MDRPTAKDIDPINVFDQDWFVSLYIHEARSLDLDKTVYVTESLVKIAHKKWATALRRFTRVRNKIPFYNSSTNKIAVAAALLFHFLNKSNCSASTSFPNEGISNSWLFRKHSCCSVNMAICQRLLLFAHSNYFGTDYPHEVSRINVAEWPKILENIDRDRSYDYVLFLEQVGVLEKGRIIN